MAGVKSGAEQNALHLVVECGVPYCEMPLFSEKVCLRYLRWSLEILFVMFDTWDYMYLFLGDAVVIRSREIS